MNKYVLIDAYNIFFRALHTINERDEELCKRLVLHIMINMIKKSCDKFSPDHMVLCCDGSGTWRKSEYPEYKLNRIEKLNQRTTYEINRDEIAKNVFLNELLPFLRNETNISVLQYQLAEADDLVSRFVKLHPNDDIIIVSTDNDFIQLLSDHVFVYNSMEDRLITKQGIVETIRNKPLKFTIKDGKVSVPKDQNKLDESYYLPRKDWVDYLLFSKCIRGDKSDNIFSAYPGVREKSTKSKIGIIEAFEDRNNKSYAWNTFMNSTWKDADGKDHLVKDDYEFNKKLIDMNEIPEEFKNYIDGYIISALRYKPNKFVSFKLSDFLTKWDLNNLNDTLSTFVSYFSKEYKGHLVEKREELLDESL